MKILWLPSWYPSKLGPFNGDFIKRHAEAVSLREDISLIYVVRDLEGKFTKDSYEENNKVASYSETIIYYYTPHIPIIGKLISAYKYRNLYRKAIQKHISVNGKPDLLHVHVGIKAGIMAGWVKRKWGIPYVVSEHWSGFLQEARETFASLPVYLRTMWMDVMKNASGWSAVSQYLSNGIKGHFPFVNCRVIPNVVNTEIFFPTQQISNAIKFIHISNLDPLKNGNQILEAFAMVHKEYPAATLEIYGSTDPASVKKAAELGIFEHVKFTDEVPQQVLAKQLNESNALLLYSSYETFGCVIIEANACGVPVIVSDIPVFHELVSEGRNGAFAGRNDVISLAGRMNEMILNKSQFNKQEISAFTGAKYNYPAIAELFSNWYHEVLAKT